MRKGHSPARASRLVLPRGVLIGLIVNALVFVGSILLFFQTRDPTPMGLVLKFSAYAWLVALILHVLKRGIPIRIVSDERKQP